MNSYWSTYVQKSEELYCSRALRFHDGNKDLWLKALQIENGMKILEVGCGGGIFCHRIKRYLPNTDVTGLDFDIGHIEYAKAKAIELNINCRFVAGDATGLPFDDNTFDVCFSHTVMGFCEPNLFVKEQYRVLKPSGKMVVMCVINRGNKPESWIPTDSCEEYELFNKLWDEASKNNLSNIKRYDDNETHYFEYLQKHNFKNVSADALAVVTYAPDSANVSAKMAIEQINEDRLSELCSVKKAHRLAPDALSNDEYNLMLEMINRRYDNRIEQYKIGEKIWDYHVSTVLAISGTK
jgi:ubiquinone/menaquinone biosynthesis C-methylase UbiE